MKKYTLKIGEKFTKKKSDELIEYSKLRDNDLRKINRKLLIAIPLLTPMSVKDEEVKKSQKILLKLCDFIEGEVYF